MAVDGALDQISASTRRYVRNTPKLVDDVYQQATLMAMANKSCKEPFPGGRNIAENIWYRGMIGGPYSPGASFDISELQVEQQKQFNLKFNYANVTLTKEEIQVFNVGPMQIFSLLKSRIENAYASIGAFMEIGAYLNGINANYTQNFNGLPEMLNDGSTTGYDGNTYANYGGLSRASFSPALNSIPVNVNGTLEYANMESTYGAASYGPTLQPTNGITTQIGFQLIKRRFQTQQRFNDTQDPRIGFNGLKFNEATIVWSRYVPGSYLYGSSGTADPIAVQFIKQMSGGVLTAYPAPSGGYPSAGTFNETLWWMNMNKPWFNYYLSTDPEYALGITGFKPAQGNTKVACQVLAGAQLTAEPRYHAYQFGITG